MTSSRMIPSVLVWVFIPFCLILVGISSNHHVLADINPGKPALKANYAVRVMDSKVPNEQFLYEAVGMLQVALEMEDDYGKALPKFLKSFQANHQNQLWKLSGGCNVMLLPNDTTYIRLEEALSHTEVNIFV